MNTQITSVESTDLAKALTGLWWLLTREDWTKDGQQRIDPTLGADPLGILTYGGNHFAAQFMKRDRTVHATDQIAYSGQNNTRAVDGYDAYFGTYEIDEQTGKVAHTLMGSITPANVGITVFRDLQVNGDQLKIQLETTTAEGEAVVRTLIWKRVS